MNHLVQVIPISFSSSPIDVCLAVEQVTLWSEWISTPNPMSDGSITEKRTRFVCTDDQTSPPQLKSDTVMYRICPSKDGVGCQETGNTFTRLFLFTFIG